MKTKIYGLSKGSRQKRIAKEAVKFCIHELKLAKHDIPLTITFKSVVTAGEDIPDRKYFGACFPWYYVDGTLKRVEIHIDMVRQNFTEQLKTLFHEFTHCKQFVKGELDINYGELHEDGITKYPVIWMKRKMYLSIDELESDNPWEKEAVKNEEKLFKKFNKRNR